MINIVYDSITQLTVCTFWRFSGVTVSEFGCVAVADGFTFLIILTLGTFFTVVAFILVDSLIATSDFLDLLSLVFFFTSEICFWM